MQVIAKEPGKYLLRFDRGEELIAGLAAFAAQERIPGAAFTALGAAEKVVLSFYNGRSRRFEEHLIKERLEIASFSGAVAWKDGEPLTHAHGVFSDAQMRVVAGHVMKCVIAQTGEVALSAFSKKVERQFDETTGLNLLR